MSTPSYTLEKQTSAPQELMAALRALERSGAITPISLVLDDPNIPYSTWLGLGEAVSQVRKASSWWIGDWYIFGATAYGDDRATAAEAIAGVSAHTLATIVRTCMYVPRSRRRLDLSFSHHTEVARLMPEEQLKWLKLAEEGNWSRETMRDMIYYAGKKFNDSKPQWQGAIVMRQQLDVEKVAREIWANATPGDNDNFVIAGELITRLGIALGEEKE